MVTTENLESHREAMKALAERIAEIYAQTVNADSIEEVDGNWVVDIGLADELGDAIQEAMKEKLGL